MFEEFFTVREARQIMRMGETKIYDLLSKGEIPAIKVGRKILIPRSSVKTFMDSQPSYK